MLRILRAQDSLRRVTEISAGMGLMPPEQREMILSAWRREARMGHTGPRRRKSLSALVAPGLPLVEVRRRGGVLEEVRDG